MGDSAGSFDKKVPQWTTEQDDLLLSITSSLLNSGKPLNWEFVSEFFPTKSASSTRMRYKRLGDRDQGRIPVIPKEKTGTARSNEQTSTKREFAVLEGWVEADLNKMVSLERTVKDGRRIKRWGKIAKEFPPFTPNECHQVFMAYEKKQNQARFLHTLAQQGLGSDNPQTSVPAQKLESGHRVVGSGQGRLSNQRGMSLSDMLNPTDSEAENVTSAMAPLTISAPSDVPDSPWEPPRAGPYERSHANNPAAFQQPSAYTGGSSSTVSPYTPCREAETVYSGIPQTYGDPTHLPPDRFTLPSFNSTPAFMGAQSTSSEDAYASWPPQGAPQPTDNSSYPLYQDQSHAPYHPHGDATKRNRSDSPNDPQKVESSKSSKQEQGRSSVLGGSSGRSGGKGEGKALRQIRPKGSECL